MLKFALHIAQAQRGSGAAPPSNSQLHVSDLDRSTDIRLAACSQEPHQLPQGTPFETHCR